ncbi:hypothetical protein Xmau_01000 [Xenorhabdus mauleonii]|uniref:Uncharacterized protein n=1 Tax=Xenorhabdus mauleonii TaxID=351675 RepID=A0A1I3LZC0_9GAMM|nr:hypothetical protein [Xenorhabdus mauleonii]PHM45350.1 hypothetical protein Xmau_01000 [Xenorhabdus mauleonii]SFI90037.1 hypothetical protein SAMN05421680_104117 [Xenorhabdus mauleonii]
MDFINEIFKVAGKIPLANSHKWPFGKIKIILADNFKKRHPREYIYLKSKYKDMLELFSEEEGYFYNNFHYLQSVTENDRIDIFAHSSEWSLGRTYCQGNLDSLADDLKRMSLRRVGVIKFQACYIGRGNWLEQARDTFIRKGINFAYMAGPTDRVVWNNPFVKYVQGDSHQAYKVVKGNINKTFPGTRYTL